MRGCSNSFLLKDSWSELIIQKKLQVSSLGVSISLWAIDLRKIETLGRAERRWFTGNNDMPNERVVAGAMFYGCKIKWVEV